MVLLTNAKILTMDKKTIENGFVIIKDGKIKDLGSMTGLKENINPNKTINLEGKILLPGFIDAHCHLGMSEDGVGDEGEDINEMSDPVTPQIRAIDAVNPLETSLKEALEAGVTTAVISPGSANPIAGQIAAVKTCGISVEAMTIAEPLAMKFSLGENPKRIYSSQEQSPMSRMATAAIIRENLMLAKRYMEDKAHAKKENSAAPDLDFKLESLIPVLEGKIKAHFHAHRAYDIQTAVRIGKEFGLDFIIIHCTEGHRIAKFLAEEKVGAICGPVIGTRSKPELSQLILENCGILMDAGVEVAISSDHPEVPSQFLPLSAAILLNHGISEEQALLGITHSAAKLIGLEDRIGRIKKGLDADLLVFAGSPLEITSRPEMIFINGEQVR